MLALPPMPTISIRNPRAVRALASAFRERLPRPTMRVTLNKVLIRRDAPIVQTPGGIYVPSAARIIPWTGEVLAVGPTLTQNIKVGDHVLVPQFTGEFVFDDKMLVVVKGDDIWAVVDKDFRVDLMTPASLSADRYTQGVPGQIAPSDFL